MNNPAIPSEIASLISRVACSTLCSGVSVSFLAIIFTSAGASTCACLIDICVDPSVTSATVAYTSTFSSVVDVPPPRPATRTHFRVHQQCGTSGHRLLCGSVFSQLEVFPKHRLQFLQILSTPKSSQGRLDKLGRLHVVDPVGFFRSVR